VVQNQVVSRFLMHLVVGAADAVRDDSHIFYGHIQHHYQVLAAAVSGVHISHAQALFYFLPQNIHLSIPFVQGEKTVISICQGKQYDESSFLIPSEAPFFQAVDLFKGFIILAVGSWLGFLFLHFHGDQTHIGLYAGRFPGRGYEAGVIL